MLFVRFYPSAWTEKFIASIAEPSCFMQFMTRAIFFLNRILETRRANKQQLGSHSVKVNKTVLSVKILRMYREMQIIILGAHLGGSKGGGIEPAPSRAPITAKV
jgi:hypothetical protein